MIIEEGKDTKIITLENNQVDKTVSRGELLEFERELIDRRDFEDGINIYWTKDTYIYQYEDVVIYSVKLLVKDGTTAQEYGGPSRQEGFKEFWRLVDRQEKNGIKEKIIPEKVEEKKESTILEDSKITRFEIINHSECLPVLECEYTPVQGRNSIILQNKNEFIIDYDLQDNGQTLKVFIQDKLPLNKDDHKHQLPPYSDLRSEVPAGTTFIHEHICKCSAVVKYRVLKGKFDKYLLLTKFDKDGNEQRITEKDL